MDHESVCVCVSACACFRGEHMSPLASVPATLAQFHINI